MWFFFILIPDHCLSWHSSRDSGGAMGVYMLSPDSRRWSNIFPPEILIFSV